MAIENFTTYDETDEGTNITVIAAKVSWNNLDRDETSHVSDSKGVNHFSGDFAHKFEMQFSNEVGFYPLVYHWALANAQLDSKSLTDAGADAYLFGVYGDGDILRLRILEDGTPSSQTWGATAGTTYFITITRDDDGGANNTGQLKAYVRTGSHSGNLEATLTQDCSAGEQNDFEYVFGVMTYDSGDADRTFDGFTQNLDLGEAPPVGMAGAMTTNTGYWGW